jgi:hypothetical protein
MPGYKCIGGDLQQRNIRLLPVFNCRVLSQDNSYNVHTLVVEIDGIVIVNVYKPASANVWPTKTFCSSTWAISIHIISCEATNSVIFPEIYF